MDTIHHSHPAGYLGGVYEMTVKQYLGQLHIINARIDEEIRQLGDLHDRALSSGGSVRYDKDKVQTSTENHTMDAIIRFMDAELIADRRFYGYVSARNKIINQINGMEDKTYSRILYDIYVIGMTMQQTADDIKSSRRQTFRSYKLALVSFEIQYTPLHNLLHGTG
jgi:hypothetical protein